LSRPGFAPAAELPRVKFESDARKAAVNLRGNLLVVCHADRGENTRIDRAWRANRRQRKEYEEGKRRCARPLRTLIFRVAQAANMAVNEAVRTLVRIRARATVRPENRARALANNAVRR